MMRSILYDKIFSPIILICASTIFTVNGFVSDDIIDTYYQCGFGDLRCQGDNQIIANDGRAYYDSLVKKSARRRWAIPVTVSYFFGNDAFNCNGQDTGVASSMFGGDFTIADVSLFCRLCAENKIRSVNHAAFGFDRGANPITGAEPFGAFRDDIVATLLAPMTVGFDIDRNQFECDVSLLYRWWFGPQDQCMLTSGLTLPFISTHYSFNPSFVGGSLYRDAFTAAQTQREDQLKQFFREYSSVEDFFIRGVLGKKNINFNKINRNSGLGDITLFTLVDCAQCFPKGVQSMQGGIALIVPSGGSLNQDLFFAPSLGQGCFAFDLFVNMIFNSPIQVFNPFVRGAIEISAPFSFGGSGVRVPMLVTQDQTRVQVKTVPGLKTIDLRLQNFENYWVDSFAEFDSTIPFLTDSATNAVSVRQGTQFIIGVGNYSYNVAYTKARLALLYNYMYRQANSISGNTDGIDSSALIKNSFAQSHTISWNLAWGGKVVDLFVGSEHVIAGQNVVRNNRLFVAVTATF